MPSSYPPEAIETCRRLYCKYGGKNHEAIEREMRAAGYARWNKLNLHNRGKEGTRGERMGWIERYGFDNSLRLHIEMRMAAVNNDEQDLYLGIKTIRKVLQVESLGKKASKETRREFREYAKIEIEARRNLDLSKDNFETFGACFENLVIWLGKIDPEAARRLVKNGDKLIEMARVHYGETETEDERADSLEDEGGN